MTGFLNSHFIYKIWSHLFHTTFTLLGELLLDPINTCSSSSSISYAWKQLGSYIWNGSCSILCILTRLPYCMTWLVFVLCFTILYCFSSVSVAVPSWHSREKESSYYNSVWISTELQTDWVHIFHPVDTVAVSKVSLQLWVIVAGIRWLIRVGCCRCIHYREYKHIRLCRSHECICI